MSAVEQAVPTIGVVLRDLKDRFFVGRSDERTLFADALAGRPRPWRILNVHGPSGAGKSTLLDAYRRAAEEAGALYIYCDCGQPGASPSVVTQRLADVLHLGSDPSRGESLTRCLEALRTAAAARPVAIAIDGYGQFTRHDRFLRESLVAQLPPTAVVVIASLVPLQGAWRHTDAWRALVRDVPLQPLDAGGSAEYLRRRGVTDPDTIRAVWAYARGFPLALTLAATAADHGAGSAAMWDSPEIDGELARRWLAEAPGSRTRAMLQAAAMLPEFDQDAVAAVMSATVAPEDFRRLTGLSTVRPGAAGWSILPLAREVIERDLRRSAPGRYRTWRTAALRRFSAGELPDGDQHRQAALRLAYLRWPQAELVRAAFRAAERAQGWRVLPAEWSDARSVREWPPQWRDGAWGELAAEATGGPDDPLSSGDADDLRGPRTLDLPGLVAAAPGAISLLKDRFGVPHGASLAVPLDSGTQRWIQTTAARDAPLRMAAILASSRNDASRGAWHSTDWCLRAVGVDEAAGLAGLCLLVLDLLARPWRGRLLAIDPPRACAALLAEVGFTCAPGPEGLAAAEVWTAHCDGAGTAAFDAPPPPIPESDPPAPGNTRQLHQLMDDEMDGLLRRLTRREREIAAAVPDGLSNAEIASHLHISEVTVKKHLTQIFRKANVASRTQLIRKIHEGG